MTDDFVLDLNAARAARAAKREANRQSLPIVLGQGVVATLPAEVPVDVLAPLRKIDGDLTLLVRQAVTAAQGREADVDTTDLVIDLLAGNPDLPVLALDIIREVAVGLMGEAGFNALLAERPSIQDYTDLAKGVFKFYGMSLGEALPSSDSSTDAGETSPGTSSTTSTPTSETSGETPQTQPSWEPVGS